MKRTLLVDGMGSIYDEDFKINKELLNAINSFNTKKILVVDGFREKGHKTLKSNNFEAFSLEEEGIKKNNSEYWKRLFNRFGLKPSNVIYIEHNNNNVKFAKEMGIKSVQYKGNVEEIREFIKDNLILN